MSARPLAACKKHTPAPGHSLLPVERRLGGHDSFHCLVAGRVEGSHTLCHIGSASDN